MKLKLHTPADHINNSRKSSNTMSINPGTGLFTFSTSLCEVLGFKEGDTLVLAQDEEKPTDWFIHRSAKGFPLKKPKSSTSLFFRSTSLANEILQSLKLKDVSHRFVVGSEHQDIEGLRVFQIITKSAQPTKRTKSNPVNRFEP